MAERMVYGGTNMGILLQSGGISREAIADLLASGAASNYHGSRTMVSFEDAYGGAPEYSFYQQEETGDDDTDACFHQPSKKRRLTAEQIHLLEKSFEVENKLEPDRKVQLAKDLGLQPRQVAVWFQNRRARWKTKQLEQDYKTLKSSYSNLKANYDDLLKEKEKLKAEVAVLTEKLLLDKKEEKNFETHKLEDQIVHQQTVKPGPDSRTEMGEMHAPPLKPAKQEDISPSNSIVFDSDSPHHSDGRRCSPLPEPVASSNALEQDYNSDLSHREDDEEGGIRHYARLDDSTCGYGLPLDDHSFWFWPPFSDVSLPHLPSDGAAQDDSQRCFYVVRGK